MIIGYKGTYNFTCLNHKYEIGQSYELPYYPIPRQYGFHYCKNPKHVLGYYHITPDFKLIEIEDLIKDTKTEYDKRVTNKLRVIREVPIEECCILFNQQIEIDGNQVKITRPNGSWNKCEYHNNVLISYEDSSKLIRKYKRI